MEFSQTGSAPEDVIRELTDKRSGDVKWQDGRTFGLVFNGGPSVHAVAEEAAKLFLHENALNPMAFPSLAEIEQDVVGWTADLLHGGPNDGGEASGFLSSGGTESILNGVLAARERAEKERGITEGEIVIAESGHAAFHKAAHMFRLKIRKSPVKPDWTADVDAMARNVNKNTVLIVGSAPQYPQGVIDPIPEIAALAQSVDANCHVDACMGGFVLPFVEMLGREVSPWDFRVEGVSSISADIHKLGYAPKGVSVILHRNKELRKNQIFMFDGWLGGFYASPGMQGTRSGLPMAAAWAVMRHLGKDGYLALTRQMFENVDQIRAAIAGIDGIRVLGDSQYHLLAMAPDPASARDIDIYALADALGTRGWFHDRQGPPDSIHMTVSNSNTGVIDQYVKDLGECVDEVAGTRTEDRSTNYAPLK